MPRGHCLAKVCYMERKNEEFIVISIATEALIILFNFFFLFCHKILDPQESLGRHSSFQELIQNLIKYAIHLGIFGTNRNSLPTESTSTDEADFSAALDKFAMK